MKALYRFRFAACILALAATTGTLCNAQTPRRMGPEQPVQFGVVGGLLVGNAQLGHATLRSDAKGAYILSELTGGKNFGAVVRFRHNHTFGLETGIRQTTRNWSLRITDSSRSENGQPLVVESPFDVVSWQVPVHLLISLRTGRYNLLRGTVGITNDFFLSGVRATGDALQHRSYRNHVVSPAAALSLGFEYDFKQYGSAQLGVAYQRQLSPIYLDSARYVLNTGVAATRRGWLQGHYASIELKWFFPLRAAAMYRKPEPYQPGPEE